MKTASHYITDRYEVNENHSKGEAGPMGLLINTYHNNTTLS